MLTTLLQYLSGAGYIGNVSNLFTTQPKDGYQYASILGVLIAPTSRGNVTLKSADTSDLPIINPNWLDTAADQEVAISMFKRIRQAFQSNAMAPVVIGQEYYPGPEIQSDAEILEYIKDNVMTLWHAASTCKMGTSDDEMAVVDSKARVFGVEGLRVVDASAFPFLPPGHPQSSVCKCLGLMALVPGANADCFVRHACREDIGCHYPGFLTFEVGVKHQLCSALHYLIISL